MYVPFPPANALDGDDTVLADIYQAAMLDIVVAMTEGVSVVSGGQTFTYRHCLVTQSDPVSQIGLAITGYSLGSGLATQRRRSTYGRPNTLPAL